MAAKEPNKKILIEKHCIDDEELLFFDGFDSAIVGVVEMFGAPLKVCYDKDKIIDILMKDMNYEEAIEYFDYNIIGAYVGEKTPVFMNII